VDQALAARRPGGVKQWRARTPLTTKRCQARAAGPSTDGRCTCTRVRDRVMDFAAHCQADRAALRVLIQYQPSLTSLGRYGLELPATRKARATTRRESHCPVEEQALADTKKNAAAHTRTIVFVDESGLSERPTRVRTWSPTAQTPVLQYSFNWKQLSLIACISYWQLAVAGLVWTDFRGCLSVELRVVGKHRASRCVGLCRPRCMGHPDSHYSKPPALCQMRSTVHPV